MRATCPDCGTQGHVAAFFVEDEGKRLAATMAGMVPELGRAVIGYLGLFKPAKTALRMARAAKLAQEIDALANAGSVCRDERSGVHRPCTPATWAAGIEQMLAQRAALSLPLDGHNYLRAVVYSLADKADALAERQTHEQLRVGKRPAAASAAAPGESRLDNQLSWIAQQLLVGAMTPEEAELARATARSKYGETA